jgi:transposase InsO family protein
VLSAVGDLAPTVGTHAACRALGVSRATVYRRRRPRPPRAPRPQPPRALTGAERHAVLDELHHPRFVDLAPAEVYATLLDDGRYLCSLRTMYRLLAAAQEVRERRNQLRHVAPKPELLATRPNEVWSWDITKLLGPAKWTYYYLYVILDIFSRYVVGWMVAHQESAALAERLLAATCEKQAIGPGQLVVHADRGGSMTSKPVQHSHQRRQRPLPGEPHGTCPDRRAHPCRRHLRSSHPHRLRHRAAGPLAAGDARSGAAGPPRSGDADPPPTAAPKSAGPRKRP